MFGAMDFSIADDGERTGHEQAAQIAVTLLADMAKPVLAPLECCFGTSPIQAEKLRPDRKVLGSATVATRAVASTGPMMPALPPAAADAPAATLRVRFWPEPFEKERQRPGDAGLQRRPGPECAPGLSGR